MHRLRRSSLLAVVLAMLLANSASAQAPSPGISPPGANDFSCKPTSHHTRPIVLVHGTAADMSISWNSLSPMLADQGYCVFALDYGGRGLGPIEDSAATLKDFIDHVLDSTGARKVAIVGHSQGGMMPRYYMKFLGGAKDVAELIGLVPSNHGTDTPLAPLVPNCPACLEQVAGSPFLQKLNEGDETPGKRISYTQITTNVVVQDKCPADITEHVGIIYDPVALQWVENALHRKGRPADPDFTPSC
jgi:esterase/lipase